MTKMPRTIILDLNFIRGHFTLILEIIMITIITVHVQFCMLRVGQREKLTRRHGDIHLLRIYTTSIFILLNFRFDRTWV